MLSVLIIDFKTDCKQGSRQEHYNGGMLQTETELRPNSQYGQTTRTTWILAGLFGLGVAMVVLLYALPRPVALHLLDERGPMEMISLAVYVLGVLWLVFMLRHRPALAAWAIAALVFLAVSEYNPGDVLTKWLDVQPANPGDPVGVNLPGAIGLSLVVLGILAGLLVSSGGRFLNGVQKGAPENRLVLIGGLFLPISFLIDRVQGYYFNWHRGFRMNKGIFYASDVIEETLEFLMPFFFFFAILLWSRRAKAPNRETAP